MEDRTSLSARHIEGTVAAGAAPPTGVQPTAVAPSAIVATPAPPTAVELTQTCAIRDLLDRLGDKWSLLVVELLGEGTKRFTELLRTIEGISQRMLTLTLRRLERDGLVTRTVHPVVPPQVDYALTPLGESLLDAVAPLVTWTRAHRAEIAGARAAYDARTSTAGA